VSRTVIGSLKRLSRSQSNYILYILCSDNNRKIHVETLMEYIDEDTIFILH